MKIALIITGLRPGGAEAMLLKLLQHLDVRHFQPHVISLTTSGDIGAQIVKLGIPVHCLHLRANWSAVRSIFTLAALLRDLRPDVVHTWMYHADLIGGIAGRLAGIKAIVWGIRHTDLSVRANKLSTLVVAKLCAWISRFVPASISVNSEVARDAHVTFGYAASKMLVLPNGFDLSRFVPDAEARSQVRQSLNLPLDTPLVGVIGRFHAQKNQLGFVKAMRMLHGQRPHCHFLLAGTAIDAGNRELKAEIDAAGLNDVTHLLGRRDDVPALMAALDVLALPSVGEAFPNVVGEAMACAVPCAVMDVGDSAYIVGDTGRVARAGDMADLAARILEVLALEPAQYAALGQRARARVSKLFEIKAVVRRYEAMYTALHESTRVQ